jgi:hypothetical protein
MTTDRKPLFILSFAFVLFSCEQKADVGTIEKPEMMRIVMKLGKQFSDGVKASDSTLLVNIYSDSAQYVQPKRPNFDGKKGNRTRLGRLSTAKGNIQLTWY